MPEDELLTTCLERLLDAAYEQAYSVIPSNHLADALERTPTGLVISQYWAIYVHDGRAGITSAPLIWFRNPEDDPRGGFNDRYAEWRSLTVDEFRYWTAQNRRARAAGEDEPMVVRWYGVKGVAGSYFFDNNVGMKPFIEKAHEIVGQVFDGFIRSQLGDLMTVVRDPAFVRF